MPNVIERFGKAGNSKLSEEVDGLLLAPSVLIKCLSSKEDPATFDKDMIQALTLRESEFSLKVYMAETDKNIVRDNLRGGVIGGYIDEKLNRLISRILDRVREIPIQKEIEFQAHENSKRFSLYDSRRLEIAFQHSLALVTCEPQHFTRNPDEREHIRTFGYTNLAFEESESEEGITQTQIWVFSPKSLSMLLRHADSAQLMKADRTEVVSLQDYKVTSSLKESVAQVSLCLDNITLAGAATEAGAIDAIFRAIEQAIQSHIDLSEGNVQISISNTTKNDAVVQVHVRFYIENRHFEATSEGKNTLTCAAEAYVRAINAALKFYEPNR